MARASGAQDVTRQHELALDADPALQEALLREAYGRVPGIGRCMTYAVARDDPPVRKCLEMMARIATQRKRRQ